MTQPDAPLAIDCDRDFDTIPGPDADLVIRSEEDVLEDDLLATAEDYSDDDAVEGDALYRKLVYFCSPRWTKTYKKRPEGDQIELVEPAVKERIVLADFLKPSIDYVVGTSTRSLGDTAASLVLVKCGGSLYWKKDEDVERPLTVEYEACITRCHDMDFVELRLRAEYGDAAYGKHFPCRYLEHDWDTQDTFRVMNKRQFYVDKLRSIENRWNASCARANLPPIYVEDWTEEPADETLELIEFINYLANSAVVAGFLPQYKQLENMKCKSSCGLCVAACKEKGVPRCCGKRASINIDKRTNEFAWCEEGERGARPLCMHFFECTPECACGDECENREVQNGRQVPLCVFREPGTGWGVRTMSPIEDGSFVTEYCGEVNVDGMKGDKARYDFGMMNRVCDPSTGTVLYKHLVISSADKGNESRFFNHSCAPNMHTECAVIERYGIFYHHISFFADRRILAGEELKFDYFPHRRRASSETIEMFESCRCGAVNCRFLSSSVNDHAPKRRADLALSSDDDYDEEDTRREKRRKASDATGVLGKRAGPPSGVLTARKAPPSCSSSDSEENMRDEEEESHDLGMRVLTARKAPRSCSSSDAEENMWDDEEDCPVPVSREGNDDSEGLDEMLDGNVMDGNMMDLYLPEHQELPPPHVPRMARKAVSTPTTGWCPSSYRYESDSEQEEEIRPPRVARKAVRHGDYYGHLMVVLPPRAVDSEEVVDLRENEEGVDRPVDADDDHVPVDPSDPAPDAEMALPAANVDSGARDDADDVEDPAPVSRPTTPDRTMIEGRLLGTPMSDDDSYEDEEVQEEEE